MIGLELRVVVMDYLMMRLEMTVDDAVRVRSVGFVCMERCQTRSRDQEGDRQRQRGAPSIAPKHPRIMSAWFAPRQCRARSRREPTAATRTEA